MKNEILNIFCFLCGTFCCLIFLIGCGQRPQVDAALAPYLENFYLENPYANYIKDISLIFDDERDSDCNVIRIDYVFWKSVTYKKCLIERPLYKCLLDKEINVCGTY